MKGSTKKDEMTTTGTIKDNKKIKSKGILINSLINKKDDKDIDTRSVNKTRKRKERQESITLYQERKVIRSNSEERPKSKRNLEKENIRRVSSSEDIHIKNLKNKKKQNNTATTTTVPTTITTEIEITTTTTVNDENEKRRTHERFAKPLKTRNFQKKIKTKIYKTKKSSTPTTVKDEQDLKTQENNIKIKKERSPSPSSSSTNNNRTTQYLDLSTLHQQVDDSEPIPSCSNRIDDNSPSLSILPNRLLSSPRNSIIATHCIYLDQSCAFNNLRKNINPIEQKLQKINKQINVLKKKIKKYENDYLNKNGVKPNHFDKINDVNVKKIYLDMNKLKKEYKLIQEFTNKKDNDTNNKNLNQIMIEIELKLKTKRESSKRTEIIEEMTDEELNDEKISVQKALLHLENIYGRPTDKEERLLVRPLYDRYRLLKRLISKTSMGSSTVNDLQTIHEDETIHFNNLVIDNDNTSLIKTTEILNDLSTPSSSSSLTTDSDTDISINENLHSMTNDELKILLKNTNEEKLILKRTLKEYEIKIQQKTGKMVQKDDKLRIEQLYKNYKILKSKHRLLDALINKK